MRRENSQREKKSFQHHEHDQRGRYGGRENFSEGAWGQSSEFGRHSPYRESENDQYERRFEGKGPKGYKRSDKRIYEDVCEALYRSPIVDATDIDVSVKDGVVTLRGVVEDRTIKKEAELCIDYLSGVEDIHNELRLRHLDREPHRYRLS